MAEIERRVEKVGGKGIGRGDGAEDRNMVPTKHPKKAI